MGIVITRSDPNASLRNSRLSRAVFTEELLRTYVPIHTKYFARDNRIFHEFPSFGGVFVAMHAAMRPWHPGEGADQLDLPGDPGDCPRLNYLQIAQSEVSCHCV